MSVVAEAEPLVVSAVPGRLRLHLEDWTGVGQRQLEARLRSLPGVERAQANPLTRNVLLTYDPHQTDQEAIVAAVRALPLAYGELHEEPAPPPATRERRGNTVRARIAVRGLDRNPHLAQRVVNLLQRQPGVRALANPLTGRVLVEFADDAADLDDLIALVADVELPDTLGEDRPADPLDPAPLVQSIARAVGVAVGVGLLAIQQLPQFAESPMGSEAAAQVAGLLGIVRGFPIVRNGLRKLLGPNIADLALSLPNILALALSNSAFGLGVTGAESVRLLSEVQARRAAYERYEARVGGSAAATPGARVRLEAGTRVPLHARVLEGYGIATGRGGQPIALMPHAEVPAGARVFGGPFVLELLPGEPFTAAPRPAPLSPTLYDRYIQSTSVAALGYAALTALLTRSFSRTFAALLLVNPRAAVIGMEAADLDASARVIRGGVTVVLTRPRRSIRRPDVLLLDGPRTVTNGFEIAGIVPLTDDLEAQDLIARARGVAEATGYPWGSALRAAGAVAATDGHFDGETASAEIAGTRYMLGPVEEWDAVPRAAALRQRGEYVLLLRREPFASTSDARPSDDVGAHGVRPASDDGDDVGAHGVRPGQTPQPLALIALRPRLARGVAELVAACRRHGVLLAMLPGGDELTARGVASRAEIGLVPRDDARGAIRARQARGEFVAFVGDGAHAGAAFEDCDLAIGLDAGQRLPLGARADLIAPDLGAVAAVVEAGARRDAAVRDGVVLSAASNLYGAIWGIRSAPGVRIAARGVYVAALAALADGWLRSRGGARPHAELAEIADPRPERWGARAIPDVLRQFQTTPDGLTSAWAAQRRREAVPAYRPRGLASALLAHLRSPLAGILAVGAGISFVLGAPADVAIIGATLAANVVIGAWEERKADRVAEALARLSAPAARVLRDGRPVSVSLASVVVGDVLLLGPGDQVTADARMLEAQGLEVDEAALTGESLPVPKSPDAATDEGRVVLEGSAVVTGDGRAVAVAVGRNTRMGSIAAALAAEPAPQSPLDARLAQLLRLVLPLAVAGGAIVTVSGLLRSRSLLSQLAIGATVAVSAVPEGLPLLTQVAEAGVARRLADRHALTRRLPAVEALGRVDVACADKTGTLTQGRLAVRVVADAQETVTLPGGHLSPGLREALLVGALASPHPDATGARSHPTDVAVVHAAEAAELGDALRVEREAESPFDPARGFHATLAPGRLCVKGAPEVLVPRCTRVRRGNGRELPLGAVRREALLDQAHELAARGLRVLMVAEGSPDDSPDDPRQLVALGFLGISDPLRPRVPAAVRRCREAGVRVLMLTGDHPATARAIAHEAGILDGPRDGEIITGAEIAELPDEELDRRLERATVIARATPLDKVRIVESLRRGGHTVAMTGDGVNDAPALRLADVGVAMGRGGTEVARQAADVVLADDDFATLVETFVEGRGFWQNMRRAISLLLGGNLGELGLVVGANALGFASPLTARQVLAVNMITDVLPGLAVALQQPEHRHLAGLAREGTAALDRPLRDDVLRRGALTGGTALAAYLLSRIWEPLPQARTVAFASVVGTQLAQTLQVGTAEDGMNRAVLGAIGGSAALLGIGLAIPPLRTFLGLALPGGAGWALIGAGTLVGLLAGKASGQLRLLLPAPNGHAPSLPTAAPRASLG